jgi:hypothetical protein
MLTAWFIPIFSDAGGTVQQLSGSSAAAAGTSANLIESLVLSGQIDTVSTFAAVLSAIPASTIGVVIDPSIESLTAKRIMESITVKRTVLSATTRRTIESI